MSKLRECISFVKCIIKEPTLTNRLIFADFLEDNEKYEEALCLRDPEGSFAYKIVTDVEYIKLYNYKYRRKKEDSCSVLIYFKSLAYDCPINKIRFDLSYWRELFGVSSNFNTTLFSEIIGISSILQRNNIPEDKLESCLKEILLKLSNLKEKDLEDLLKEYMYIYKENSEMIYVNAYNSKYRPFSPNIPINSNSLVDIYSSSE